MINCICAACQSLTLPCKANTAAPPPSIVSPFVIVPPLNDGPAGPCGPVSPLGPCGPVAPVAPLGPVAPVSPLGPLILTEDGVVSLVEFVQLNTPLELTDGLQYLKGAKAVPVLYAITSPSAIIFCFINKLPLFEPLK